MKTSFPTPITCFRQMFFCGPGNQTRTAMIMMAHSAVSVQPAMVMTTESAKIGQWSSGVCDCCEDMSVCCCGFWCPYCLMCRTSENFGECFCLPLLEICFGGMLHPITLAMRSSMRERYNIKGSIPDDCCMVTCCTLCVWCQMAREMKTRRRSIVVINTAINTAHQQPQALNQSNQPIYHSQIPMHSPY
ncbi:plac8 onzin related protein 6 isoform X2 [Triplophysa dalaica]|uniref:plac8 onzin related protein 6 isoform X2 n=1 Tax=Triplophysa dalaica TaxID=1582913 RepID=UPI0024DF849A|nr:plac8 onzin related protein 6 isoform X2 [Triplophysa dalaica]